MKTLKRLLHVGPLRPVAGHGFAILAVAVCFGLRWVLGPALGLDSPFINFVLGIIITAWFGGLGPGLFALLLSAIAGLYGFVEPGGILIPVHATGIVQLCQFLILGVVASGLGSYARLATTLHAAEQERLAVTLTSIADAVIATDAAGCVTFMNAEAERLTGWTCRDAEGRALEEVFHIVSETTRALAASPVQRVLASGCSVGLSNHTLLIARDGTERPIADSAAPIRDRQGLLLGVVLVFTDASEQRKVDQVIRESEARFRMLADSAPVLIWMNDPDGTGFVNKAYLDFLGCTLEDVRRMDWVSRLHPDDAKAYVGNYLRAVENRERFAARFRFRRHDGQYRWLQSVGLPRYDTAGAFAGFVGCSFDITEMVQVEEQQRSLAAHRQLALNAAHLGWWSYDPRTQSVTYDERYAEIYGIDAKDCQIGDIARLLDPEDLPRVWAAVEAAMDPVDPQPYAEEYRVNRPDGSMRWVEARGLATFEEDGTARRIANFVGTVSDVTERKRVEAVLAESADALARERERLAIALGAARLGVYEWRVGEGTVWWSPEMFPVFGVDPGSFVPTVEAFSALIHPEDQEELWRKTDESLARREQFMHEYRIVRPDGLVRWVMNRSQVGLDAAGNVARITGVAADVTERREAEELLRSSEERLRLAASAGRVGVWEWNIVQNSVSWSESLYAIHGVDKAGFKGTVEAFADLIHPGDRDIVTHCIEQSLQKDVPYEVEFRAVRPDGALVWLYTQATVVRAPSGEPVRMLGATVDITERKRAEEALRETDRRKDEFLATLAHELRNPLAPIRTAVQILHLTGSQDKEARQVREMVERQVDHLVRLVDDLLDVSRINRGKIELRRHPIRLAEVVQAAIETSGPFITAGRHELNVIQCTEPLNVDGDAVRLTQVVANLLNNAAKYTPQGGRITVTVERQDQLGAIRVRDTGVGIPPNMLDKVFEMFTQVNRHLGRAQGGLGIGLTLVRQLVELHGGSVDACSEGEGSGAEFVVRLPLVQRPAKAAEEAANRPLPITSLRVLVVDDNVDAANSLARLLALNGHDVKTAHDGLTGLTEVNAFRPDVVLLDLGMPGIDGYETARRMRASEPGKAVLLIALTGWGQEDDRRRTSETGFDYHLVKPLQLADLEALLRDGTKSS